MVRNKYQFMESTEISEPLTTKCHHATVNYLVSILATKLIVGHDKAGGATIGPNTGAQSKVRTRTRAFHQRGPLCV